MPRPWRRSGEPSKFCASSANLFAFTCGPPWAWINGSAVFTELDIEHGLTRAGCEYRCNLGCRPHGCDRLSRKYKLADVDRNALHPGDQHMIPASGIEDQELTVAAEGSGVNNPAVTRGCDLSAGTGCQRNAFFRPTDPVGTAKVANPGSVNRQRQQSLGGGERNRRAQPAGIFQRGKIGLAVERCGRALQVGRSGRSGGAFQLLLHPTDQALQAVGLTRQSQRAGALRFKVFLDGALLALALFD